MILVNLSEAKAQLSDLIARAVAGEKIVICKHNRPMVELVSKVPPKKRKLGKNVLGIIQISPEFFEPISDDELAEWERPLEP